MEVEVDPLRPELHEDLQQALQAATQPVDRPGCNHVYVASRDGLHQPVETGALSSALGAGDAVIREHGDDAPAVALGNGLELAALVRNVLLERADPEVERDPSVGHLIRVPELRYKHACITTCTGSKPFPYGRGRPRFLNEYNAGAARYEVGLPVWPTVAGRTSTCRSGIM